MGGLTLQDLLGFDAGPWHATAAVWQRVASGLDDAAEQLLSGTRYLHEAWPNGTGSAAALEKGTTLRTAVDGTYPPAKRLADLFDQHAYAMKGLQDLAQGVIASAREAGYSVDTAAGTITAPAAAYMGANLDQTSRHIAGLLNDLRSVLERAQSQDDTTAGIINGNVPSMPGGAGTSQPGEISRAVDLATRLKDPAYQPSTAELEELRNLITKYGNDRVFAYDLLTALGPKGLLELNGTLATYQLDRPGKDADYMLFDDGRADLVRNLQISLGQLLSTATEATGARTGPGGGEYVPGAYELPNQWVADLMIAGRSRMAIGDPSSPGRYVEDVYGYQLLGPLLHNVGHDARFLATVGGDMVDFEMSEGKNSALWNESRGENIRLDWTRGHDGEKSPAGYDPVSSLMDALATNGDGTRDLLTDVTQHAAGDPKDGRLPRLDYLLTDRDWNATPDLPGGAGWAAELMQHGADYKNPGLDQFGVALEHAAIDRPGMEARRLTESIIYETNVDEQASGYANGVTPGNGKTEDFMNSNMIHPEIRDSMGDITSAYIADVNANAGDYDVAVSGKNLEVDSTHLARFLADVGKDQGAHDTIAAAEATYAADRYDRILAREQNPKEGIGETLDAMGVTSQKYGHVMGAIDLGATEAHHATSADLDKQHNKEVEDRYKVIGLLADEAVGATTSRIPVPVVNDLVGMAASETVGSIVSDAKEQEMVDNHGRANWEVGNVLGAGRTTAVDLTELSLYNSGKLDHLPDSLNPGGSLKPVSEWDERDYRGWQEYKRDNGEGTLGKAATEAGSSYQDGYEWAKDLIGIKEKPESPG